MTVWTQTTITISDGSNTARQLLALTDGNGNYLFTPGLVDATGTPVGPANPLDVQPNLVNAAGAYVPAAQVSGPAQAAAGIQAVAPMLAGLAGFDPAPGGAGEGARVNLILADDLLTLLGALLREVQITNLILGRECGLGAGDLAALRDGPEFHGADTPVFAGNDPTL